MQTYRLSCVRARQASGISKNVEVFAQLGTHLRWRLRLRKEVIEVALQEQVGGGGVGEHVQGRVGALRHI